jgi:hypothetical protein
MTAYEILPAINAWCAACGFHVPRTRRGWGYLGQTFLEWPLDRTVSEGPLQVQIELLPTSAPFEKVTAKVFACDPLGLEPNTAVRLALIEDVGEHMEDLYRVLGCFFPAEDRALDFCLMFAKAMRLYCKGTNTPRFDLSRSVYLPQFRVALVDALNGEGYTNVSFKADILQINYEHPESPLEQALFVTK